MKHYNLLLGIAVALLFGGCKKGDQSNTNTAPPVVLQGLTVSGFSPSSAQAGASITISGTGFGSDPKAVQVFIGGSTSITPTSVSSSQIIVQTNLSITSGKIKVYINGNSVASADDFTLLIANLRVIGWQNGRGDPYGDTQLGAPLYIYAEGFGTDTNKIFISFGGTKPVKADYISPTGRFFGTTVPRYAQAGKIKLTVDTRTATSIDDINFSMSLRDFTPKSFSSGDTVKITGVSFTNISDMSIGFNNNKVTKPFKVTDTTMLVIVPLDAKSGYLTVGTFSGVSDFIYDAAHKYTVVPTVSFNNVFTPSSAKVGDLVRLNGDFTGVDITTLGVSFGGSKAVQPTSIAGPDIYVKVPSDAKTGKIMISRTGYKSLTGSFILTITP